MRRVLFRADASSTIGTGHIMRDLVLAKQFQEEEVLFATRDLPGNLNEMIAQGYSLELLSTDAIEELITLIKSRAIDLLIIDHYNINYRDEKRIKDETGVQIFVLDDTYERHECDILLNHNIYAEAKKYDGLVPRDCELRCGKMYTLLREEFIQVKASPVETFGTKHVFLAMGGADHAHLNIKILTLLKSYNDYHIDVVTTTANEQLTALQTYTTEHKNITVHINSKEVAKLMKRATFAIVTPSVILNELFYMQIPFIAIQTAKNQSFMVDYLKARAYKVLQSFDKTLLLKNIKQMADALDATLTSFTELTLDEKKLVLKWRNHETVRQWMFQTEPIPLTQHLQYLDSLYMRKDRKYFLVKLHDQPKGVIDFTQIDREKRKAELGIYTKPNTKGIGQLLMDKIVMYAFETMQLECLKAKVFSNNKAALTLYKKYAFKTYGTEQYEDREIICMELCR